MYPDAYEVGLPNQGVQILYEVLNERDWIIAERTYSVWPDMEQVMRTGDEHGPIPQFTVDSHRPVGAFDLFGLSFSTELGYTNMLNALDLAGIPLHAADRTDDDPVVIAGGHAAFNPEPIADFIDAAVLGDGEEVVLAISEVVARVEGRGARRAAATSCCAASRSPAASTSRSSTTSATPPTARSRPSCPNRPGIPFRVSKHTLMDLDQWPYPANPLVPLAETVHERFSVEIFRGCTRGCRFCQAGMITRPVRERSIETIGDDGRERHPQVRASRRSGCCRSPAPTTPRSPRSPRTWPTATRAPTSPSPCPAPASTPSTSRWPTSSPATAAARA